MRVKSPKPKHKLWFKPEPETGLHVIPFALKYETRAYVGNVVFFIWALFDSLLSHKINI